MARAVFKSYPFFLIAVLLIVGGVSYCSEPAKPDQDEVQLLLSKDGSITKQLIAHINGVPKGGYVGIENPFLTDPAMVKALVAAAKKEVAVVANLGRGTKKEIIKQLTDAGVEVHLQGDIHAKRLLFAHEDPASLSEKSSVMVGAFIGSHNFSCISWGHQEDMVKDSSLDMFKRQYKDQQALAHNEYENVDNVRSPIKKSPTKPELFSSRIKNLNKAKVLRIKRLLDDLQSKDALDITSMTFDAEDITDAVTSVANYAKEHKISAAIRLLLDASALKHRDLLDTMHAAGVKIYIFNHDHAQKIHNKFPNLQHTKLLTRYRHTADQKHLVIISTGNCTERSNNEVNLDTYYPGNEQLYTSLHAFCDELQDLCIAYENIPQAEPVDKKHKQENNDVVTPSKKAKKR